jgi:hypothetical protein
MQAILFMDHGVTSQESKIKGIPDIPLFQRLFACEPVSGLCRGTTRPIEFAYAV